MSHFGMEKYLLNVFFLNLYKILEFFLFHIPTGKFVFRKKSVKKVNIFFKKVLQDAWVKVNIYIVRARHKSF